MLNKKVFSLAKKIKRICYYSVVTSIKNRLQDVSQCRYLLIVAHPDDETLFFSNFLHDNKSTFVLCLTNGANATRAREFWKTLSYYGVKGNILNNSDSLHHSFDRVSVQRQFLKYKSNWELVLTHNCEGEYGHIQHISAHNIVVDYFIDYNVITTLVDSSLFNLENMLTESIANRKIELFKTNYQSQLKNILNPNDIYFKYFYFENTQLLS